MSLPTTLALTLRLSANCDADLGGAVDDVRVGEDRAVPVEHEARAGGLAALLLGQVERRLRALDDLRADEDDARRVALVDVARGEPVLAGGVAGRRQRRLLDDGAWSCPPPRLKAPTTADRRRAAEDGETRATVKTRGCMRH